MKQNRAGRAIVFDFGKVLLDWDVRYLYRNYFPDAQSLENFLVEIDFYEWNNRHDSHTSLGAGIEEQVIKYPHWENLIRLYDAYYPLSLRGAIEGSVRILDQLYEQGQPLYGLSNFNSAKFASIKPQYPFFEYFDAIVLSGDTGVVKPNPKIFQILLKRIERVAADCIFIDDSLLNVQSALELGFDAIHFRSPELLADDLNDRGFNLVLND